MTYFVDRIEEGRFVVCEAQDGSQAVFALSCVSGSVKEGDCLKEEDGMLVVDTQATLQRREKMRMLQKNLFED